MFNVDFVKCGALHLWVDIVNYLYHKVVNDARSAL